ncbi:MAG: Hpt domain-containing protein [FCB group bacterium]|nr:Hpt domain-containing protein [FCB group bacterium]
MDEREKMDEEMMQELKLIFVEEMQKRIASLEQSLVLHDREAIQHLGHKIKGTGGSFGFENVSLMGADLESAAIAEDWQTIEKTIFKLVDWQSENE